MIFYQLTGLYYYYYIVEIKVKLVKYCNLFLLKAIDFRCLSPYIQIIIFVFRFT